MRNILGKTRVPEAPATKRNHPRPEPVTTVSERLDLYLVAGPDGKPLGNPMLEITVGAWSRTIKGVKVRYDNRPPEERWAQPATRNERSDS